MSVEELMRAALRDVAEPVVPEPEPLRRLQARRARQDRQRLVIGGIVAVLLAAVVVAVPSRIALQTAQKGHPISSDWVRAMLESPSRGNLAQPGPLLADVQHRAARRGDKSLDRTKVLYLGDVAGRRFLAFARYSETRAALYFNDVDADTDEPVKRLVDGGVANAPVTPLIRMVSRAAPVTVALAPAGCEFAVSGNGTVTQSGLVQRNWAADERTPDWMEASGYRAEERWRITCDGRVRYQGTAAPPELLTEGDLVAGAGYSREPLTERWAGMIGSSKWTLSTSRLSNGGAGVVLSFGTADKANLATGFMPVKGGSGPGVLTTSVSPSEQLVAVRVPERVGGLAYWGSTLVVAGPVGAWTAEIEDPPTTLPLVEGVGTVTIRGPVHGTIVAKDVEGKVLGTTRLDETGGFPRYFGEPIIDAW